MAFGETEPSEIYGGASAPAAPGHQVTFDRRELNRIFGLYGRMVAAGEWRDYAIDFLKDRAVFSVFRRSSEVPIYRIEKNPKLERRQGAYSVVSATGLLSAAAMNSSACCACWTRARAWLRCDPCSSFRDGRRTETRNPATCYENGFRAGASARPE